MVSMYVDIRQAAELLAKFSTGHRLSHVAIELANEIRAAARQGGLQFYTQYRDPIDGLMHVSDPANILGASFSIAEDEQGKRYVKPNGYTEGDDRKAILQSQGWPDTPEPHDGEWVAYCVVSIEDVVKHPCFGFPKEKQDRIIEAHKAAAVALLPAEDAAPAPTQEAETPAPEVVASEPAKRKTRKPSWVVEAMPYMKRLYASGKYRSNSVFYKVLKKNVNDDDSPFTLVRGELYCDKAGTTVAEGTLGNVWKTVRAP